MLSHITILFATSGCMVERSKAQNEVDVMVLLIAAGLMIGIS
jgi:hypothetical protein